MKSIRSLLFSVCLAVSACVLASPADFGPGHEFHILLPSEYQEVESQTFSKTYSKADGVDGGYCEMTILDLHSDNAIDIKERVDVIEAEYLFDDEDEVQSSLSIDVQPVYLSDKYVTYVIGFSYVGFMPDGGIVGHESGIELYTYSRAYGKHLGLADLVAPEQADAVLGMACEKILEKIDPDYAPASIDTGILFGPAVIDKGLLFIYPLYRSGEVEAVVPFVQ